ncbi:MAG: hypothetical protein RXQ94_06835 [Caldivirga sp.]
MSETPLSLTVTATILGLAKRPGTTRDGRNVLSLNVEIDGHAYELNLVTKPNQGMEDALNYLAKTGHLTKNGNRFTLLVPTWALGKAKGSTIWVHVEDYEKLKGTT